jgi:hypothetical protein
MGQPVTVIEKPSSRSGIRRFETNRALSGMGHERYASLEEADGVRPVDVLARRLFEHGGVDHVHINGNVITVELARGGSGDGLAEVIGGLYTFYTDAPAES